MTHLWQIKWHCDEAVHTSVKAHSIQHNHCPNMYTAKPYSWHWGWYIQWQRKKLVRWYLWSRLQKMYQLKSHNQTSLSRTFPKLYNVWTTQRDRSTLLFLLWLHTHTHRWLSHIRKANGDHTVIFQDIGSQWGSCTLRHGTQSSMDAILASHPALCTWLDWMAIDAFPYNGPGTSNGARPAGRDCVLHAFACRMSASRSKKGRKTLTFLV